MITEMSFPDQNSHQKPDTTAASIFPPNAHHHQIQSLRNSFSRLSSQINENFITSLDTFSNDIKKSHEKEEKSFKSCNKNKPKNTQKKIVFDLSKPEDKALELSYRMSKIRKNRQLDYLMKLKEDTVEKKRQVGKIKVLPPIRHHEKKLVKSIDLNRSRYERKRQSQILKKSLKCTKKYYEKKMMKSLVFSVIDEAVSIIEKKRSFFSYKFSPHRKIKINEFLLQKSQVKIEDKLSPNFRTISTPHEQKLKSIKNVYNLNLSRSLCEKSQSEVENEEEEEIQKKSESGEKQSNEEEKSDSEEEKQNGDKVDEEESSQKQESSEEQKSNNESEVSSQQID